MTVDVNRRKEEILEAHRNRFACKKYDTTKNISDEDMDFILEVGSLAPSSFGFQPWKFLVIDNDEFKSKVLESTPRLKNSLETADKLIVILAKNSSEVRYSSGYVNHMLREINGFSDNEAKTIKEAFRKFQEKESSSMHDTMSIYHWSWRQSYLPLATMVSAASEIGIDTCPIEEYNEKQLEKILVDKGVLDTREYSVSVLLALGYREELPIKLRDKKQRKDMVEWIR